MISDDKIAEIFCIVDDFCKEMIQTLDANSIQSDNSIKKRKIKCKLNESEVIPIMVFFQIALSWHF